MRKQKFNEKFIKKILGSETGNKIEYYYGTDKPKKNIYFTKNGLNENVIIIIHDNFLEQKTMQSNGWIRTNNYYLDNTSEELYSR